MKANSCGAPLCTSPRLLPPPSPHRSLEQFTFKAFLISSALDSIRCFQHRPRWQPGGDVVHLTAANNPLFQPGRSAAPATPGAEQGLSWAGLRAGLDAQGDILPSPPQHRLRLQSVR